MHAKLKYHPGCKDRQATVVIPVHKNIIRPSARKMHNRNEVFDRKPK